MDQFANSGTIMLIVVIVIFVSANSVSQRLECYFGPFGLLLLLTIYFLQLIYFWFVFFAHLISCRYGG